MKVLLEGEIVKPLLFPLDLHLEGTIHLGEKTVHNLASTMLMFSPCYYFIVIINIHLYYQGM